MDIVLTLVVNPGLEDALENATAAAIATLENASAEIEVLHTGRAIDIKSTADSIEAKRKSVSEVLRPYTQVDWCLQQNTEDRKKSMLIADMDSTMITVECIDELADFVGKKEAVSEITEAAMRGELDFEGALKERVALLKGLPVVALETCYAERIELMPGAKPLVRTMTTNGAFAALVSGGFTFFTDRVADTIGFHTNRANILGIENGALTGMVVEPICGAQSKLEALGEYCAERGIEPAQVLAVGDGANDIPMLQAAGLGVAYHAKPKTAAATHAAVRNGDLSTLLYFQGYCREEFAQ
ncbi:MAG: phosphoserine phosphatase SerB [Kordiimonadaceae bacterium]|nr:phosphoserine phosphatase SerB [Kordiimonadaceae bacterium]MBO6569004.1 phosphoserine phosphatase SerB [Kordiimonadaceae bacterium]MBO6964479.1 phosphoserine phosphatase SerB [Kordiimonadaceae bacterium]